MVQAFTRHYAGLVSVTQLLRRPLWLEAEHPEMAALAALLKQRDALGHRSFLYWVPELTLAEAAPLMRPLRLRRVMTGYSSIWLDLGAKRTRSTAASLTNGATASTWPSARRSACGLPTVDTISIVSSTTTTANAAIAAATKPAGGVVVATALARHEPVASALLLRHGAAATYYVGWTSAEGRRLHGQNLALWRGLTELKQAGVRWLDRGGIDTARQPGIAHFKLGLGGDAFTLAGSYL